MRVKGLESTIVLEPDNTWDAFQLGRLFEITQEELEVGLTAGKQTDIRTELVGIRFDVSDFVEYVLNHLSVKRLKGE